MGSQLQETVTDPAVERLLRMLSPCLSGREYGEATFGVESRQNAMSTTFTIYDTVTGESATITWAKVPEGIQIDDAQ